MSAVLVRDWLLLALSLFNTLVPVWLGLTVLLNAKGPGRESPSSGQGATRIPRRDVGDQESPIIGRDATSIPRRDVGDQESPIIGRDATRIPRRDVGDQESPTNGTGRGGLWLAGAGLLAGAAFFVSHAIILGTGLDSAGTGLDFWWRLGWLLLILMPCGWYTLTLWYGSFWEHWRSGAGRRHLASLALCAALALALVALLLFANPLPSLAQGTALSLASLRAPAFLVLAYAYPLYNLLAIGFSLDALRRPMPAARMLGDLARGRARPWLLATAALLLAVSLLVTAIMAWGLTSRAATLDLSVMLWFDLLISALVSLAIVLLGQAIIVYEIFTGQVLPRRGFARQWRRTLILAAGTGLVLSGTIALRLPAIYALLLSVLVSAVFFALVTWRSHLEREYTMSRLRPFVASERLYEQVLSEHPLDGSGDGAVAFAALCEHVLGAKLAYLIAAGPQAAFAGPPLSYPPGLPAPMLDGLAARFATPARMIAPVEPDVYHGAEWAAPLWSERGLSGVLLLGAKSDGGLYTQEEIEIARASGERLIDARAGAEIARRLLALQRARLAESQVLDRRTRRVLHDDVLPELQAALLNLNGDARAAPAVRRLTHLHRQIAQLLHDLPPAAGDVARHGLLPALRELVGSEWSGAFDRVTWQLEPAAEQSAPRLSPLSADVLYHAAREAIRNAARHARGSDPTRPLHLRIACVVSGLLATSGTSSGALCLTIEDDGVGMLLHPAAPVQPLHPSVADAGGGPSPQPSVAGHGLALHATLLAIVGGSLTVESEPGAYTRVTLCVPAALD